MVPHRRQPSPVLDSVRPFYGTPAGPNPDAVSVFVAGYNGIGEHHPVHAASSRIVFCAFDRLVGIARGTHEESEPGGIAHYGHRLAERRGDHDQLTGAIGVGVGAGPGVRSDHHRKNAGSRAHLVIAQEAQSGMGEYGIKLSTGAHPVLDGVVRVQLEGVGLIADPDAVVIFVGDHNRVPEDHGVGSAGRGRVGGFPVELPGELPGAEAEPERRVARDRHGGAEGHRDLDDFSCPVPARQHGRRGYLHRFHDGSGIHEDRSIVAVPRVVQVGCHAGVPPGDASGQRVSLDRDPVVVPVPGHHRVPEHQLGGGAIRGHVGGVSRVGANLQGQHRRIGG